MGDIVNLRQARKRAARQAREAVADTNRATFGVSRSSKAQARGESERAKAKLDAHRLEPGDVPSPDKP